MSKIENELSRMKVLMNYGLQNESKHYNDDVVEYWNKGADGKTYGIIREGTKYYIKALLDSSKKMIAENFDYLGGFCNRKRYEYNSYAEAIKDFDLKMKSIRDANDPNKGIVIESLDPNRKEVLIIEGNEDMKRTIARQRQIMMNAQLIQEGKTKGSCHCGADGCGDAKEKGSPFGDKSKGEKYKEVKGDAFDKDGNPKVNEEEVLAWNDNKDYMDKSHGTEIGDGTPFDKCPKSQTNCDAKDGTVVEEGVKEPGKNVNDWDEGLPNKEGTGDVKTEDGKPFDKKVNEDIFSDDDFNEPADDMSGQDLSTDIDNAEYSDEDEDLKSLLKQMLASIEDLKARIGDVEYSDDSLYDDSEGDIEGEEGLSDIDPTEGGEDEVSYDIEGDDDDNHMYEDVNRKKKVNEKHELNDFGKHPAYQKEPFKYPNPNHKEMNGYEDWNDESVEGAKPYGQSIGDGTPFDEPVEHAENSIQEAINNFLRSKKKVK